MFVQTGHFLEKGKKKKEEKNVTFYGSELKANNTRLAKMNLAIHGMEGSIKESNSFYTDPHDLVGKCDFVMANPPFNVKKVDKKKDYVKNDVRLFEDVGIPKADNGNYLWIQYFYHYLNDKGRAGFVMASSATDAGNTEKAIRQKLIETDAVDCVVSVGNNFFYTRSLPCHVWFLDKGKSEANKDKILMIDARNTFRVVTSTINDYSPGQLRNFSAIMAAYRGETSAIATANTEHQKDTIALARVIAKEINTLRQDCQKILAAPFTPYNHKLCDTCKAKAEKQKASTKKAAALTLCAKCQAAFDKVTKPNLDFTAIQSDLSETLSIDNQSDFETSKQWIDTFTQPVEALFNLVDTYQSESEAALTTFKQLEDKEKKSKANKAKKEQLDANSRLLKTLSVAVKKHHDLLSEDLNDYKQQVKDWESMLDNFPGDQYQDIEGLCKVVDREEVKENDYSLNPGRYVGYSIRVDQGFDYKKRMKAINKDLADLNEQAVALLKSIIKVEV